MRCFLLMKICLLSPLCLYAPGSALCPEPLMTSGHWPQPPEWPGTDWPKYWPLIGWELSRDLDTGLWLADQAPTDRRHRSCVPCLPGPQLCCITMLTIQDMMMAASHSSSSIYTRYKNINILSNHIQCFPVLITFSLTGVWQHSTIGWVIPMLLVHL